MARWYLGVDFGEKRVGVAVGDDETRLARAFITIANDHALVDQLKVLVNEYHPAAIVLGLPRNLEGDETPQSQLVRRFGSEVLAPLGCPVEFQDEALTSEAVIHRLHPTKEQVQDGLVDREAAAMILQDYLDQL